MFRGRSLPLAGLKRRDQRPETTAKDLAQAIADLEGAYSLPKSPNDSTEDHFITLPALRKVIDRDRLRKLLRHYRWYKEDLLEVIYRDFLRIIGALIVVKWPDWKDFKAVFLDLEDRFGRPSRRDTRLPFLNVDFITDTTSRRLLKLDQYIFCPIVIEEDSHDPIMNAQRRLPFLSSIALGGGSYGTVSKVEVEKYQILYTSGEAAGEPNTKRKFMARKVLQSTGRGPKSFQTETKNLKLFKNAVASCKVILLSFASFVHGSTLNIIYPLADLDLHTFLSGRYDNFSTRAAQIQSFQVFEQAQDIASALQFLHKELYIDGQASECAHLDLKPENILVFWLNNRAQGSDTSKENPAGIWKLSDFGLSVVRSQVKSGGQTNESADKKMLAPGDIAKERSSMPAPRAPGPWQPPELEQHKVSKETDMWSFGCVLIVVLAFAIGGPAKVKEVYKRRDSSNSYAHDYFYTKDENPLLVNPGVMSWLEEEETAAGINPQKQWIQMTRKLVLELLQIKKEDRSSARTARDSLQNIKSNAKTELSLWQARDFDGIVPDREPSFGLESNDSLPLDMSQELRPKTPVEGPSHEIDTMQRHPARQVNSKTAHEHTGNDTKWQHDPGPSSASPKRAASHSIPAAPSIRAEDDFEPHRLRTREPSFAWPADAGEPTFAKLEAPTSTLQAAMSSDGKMAAFLSKDQVFVYFLSSLAPLQRPWSVSAGAVDRVSWASNRQASKKFKVPSGCQWTSIRLAGIFVAICSAPTAGSDDGTVQVHNIDVSSGNFEDAAMKTQEVEVPETCYDTRLSSKGALLLMSPDHLDLHFPDLSHCQVPLSSSSELQTAVFSDDGEWLCAWYTTDKTQWWCIWNMSTNPPTRTNLQKSPIPPAPMRSINFRKILLPFSSKPWFGACDQYGNGHLIRERHGSSRPKETETFEELCEGVVAGVAIPDDKGMLIVRRPDSTPTPKVAVGRVSTGSGSTRVQVRPWTQVSRSFDGDKCGLCLINSGNAVIFFTCHLDGYLIRKKYGDIS